VQITNPRRLIDTPPSIVKVRTTDLCKPAPRANRGADVFWFLPWSA
jgi:hypothetical protein